MTEPTDTPDRPHESLCNCRKYPDKCASRDDCKRALLVHTFGHAEEALEEALKQGWTAPASAVTPPVAGETTDAAVTAAARAMTTHPKYGPDFWANTGATAHAREEVIARLGLTAALPHLTAERDAEAKHTPIQIGTHDAEGYRTHTIPGDVCLGCSSPAEGRWVPVSQCPQALAALDAEEAEELPASPLGGRDAETTALRAEIEQLRRDTNLGWEARHAAEDDLDQVIEALGLDPESVQLEDVVERAETLAEWGKTAKAIFGPDTAPAAVLADPAPEVGAKTPEQSDEDEIDEFHPDYCPAELAFDGIHSSEYFKRGFLCAWCHADPAPSTPAAQETPDA